MFPFCDPSAAGSADSGFARYSVTYTTVGSQSVSKPTGATTLVIEAIGPGGGSYFASAGGGSYAKTTLTGSSIPASITIIIPDVGKGGQQPSGQTWVYNTSSSNNLCVADYGQSDTNGAGGTGGQASASSGDITYSGGNGTSGGSGVGGGAAGPSGPGQSGDFGGASGGDPAGAGGARSNPGNDFGGGSGAAQGISGTSTYGGRAWVRLTWS